MDVGRFGAFREGLAANLPAAVDEILGGEKGKDCCAIAFLTTDDFYGCYMTWDTTGSIDDFCDWPNELRPDPDFLYQPLVDVVDSSKDIDVCNASPEKWDFAHTLLTVLAEAIEALPEEVFTKNGFEREDVLFFCTMSDGDYIEEMMNESLHLFNSDETLEAFDF